MSLGCLYQPLVTVPVKNQNVITIRFKIIPSGPKAMHIFAKNPLISICVKVFRGGLSMGAKKDPKKDAKTPSKTPKKKEGGGGKAKKKKWSKGKTR